MSKLKSIKTKISAVGIGATLLIGLGAGIYALSESAKASQSVIDRTATQMIADVKSRVDAKKRYYVAVAQRQPIDFLIK